MFHIKKSNCAETHNMRAENNEVTCMKNILKILTLGLSGKSSHKKECVVHLLLPGEPEGPGCCAILLAFASLLLCLALLPLSLFFCVKVSTEHARQLLDNI